MSIGWSNGAARVRRMLSKAGWLVRGRMGAIQWLVLCGAALVLAIALGTAYLAMQFRDRAIQASKRELSNTTLLLARHFDQQLSDFQHIQQDIIAHVRAGGIDTPEAFERQMSLLSTHEMLRSRLATMPRVGALNIFNHEGWLINSSEMWPVADAHIRDRRYFREFTSGRPTPDVIVEHVVSRVTKVWTTVFARKIVDKSGKIIGFAIRGVEPVHFLDFVRSLALSQDTTISIVHRDGTMIARYPEDPAFVGKNVSDSAVFQSVLSAGGSSAGRFFNATLEDRIGAIHPLNHFPILIAATTKTESALADWRAQSRLQFVAAALAVIVVVTIIFLIVRQLQRQHRAAQALLSAKSQHLDTAINTMTQGLLLFDAHGRLVMCNQRYMEMFALSPDIVKPGCTLQELMQHRKDNGTFDGDIDSYCAQFLDPNGDEARDIVVNVPDGRVIHLVFKRAPDGGWATTLEDITERRRVEAKIAHLAHYDSLTGLPNRTLFQQRADELLQKAAYRRLAILYIDIDEFKRINDSLGHTIGDEFLKAVAVRLHQSVGPLDFVARLGGDEFAVILREAPSDDHVDALVGRIYASLRTPFDCRGHSLAADASIGIAMAPDHGGDLHGLLKCADLAMYAAKSAGRRTHRFFEPSMEAQANHRRELEIDLRAAIAAGDFAIHYQPLVDLNTNAVTGCEALLRWHHPRYGSVSPAEFVPIAEETGLIEEIGDWVLRTACTEAANWPGHVRIAVNVSPVQFRSQALPLKVAAALAETGLDPRRLELEITEAVLIADDDAALVTLNQLRELGVRIALDDFGTGYSSLSYLQRFPFDKIKIDRTFVKELARCTSIIKAVVSIAADRNMVTTAEGVETEEQRAVVHALGCTQMQGYLFSPPRPAQEVRALFAGRVEPRRSTG